MRDKLRRRFLQGALASALLILLAWIVQVYRGRLLEFDDVNLRTRTMSQMLGALVAYAREYDEDSLSHHPAHLIKVYGEKTMARYAWITTKADPAPSEVVLIERPDLLESEWCFALFDDGHVTKLLRSQATQIISKSASIIAPAN